MKTHLQPIPTVYAGETFRSRLEADWATTFDAYGLPWLYEPQGYVLSDGRPYLPDFYLPSVDVWVEVKASEDGEGIGKATRLCRDLFREARKVEGMSHLAFHPFNDPLPILRPRVVLALPPVRLGNFLLARSLIVSPHRLMEFVGRQAALFGECRFCHVPSVAGISWACCGRTAIHVPEEYMLPLFKKSPRPNAPSPSVG